MNLIIFKGQQIEGTELYFKTLPLDITGTVGDLDLMISGQDTVEIIGKIEASGVIVFYEFTTEDIGVALPEDEGVIMSYRINVPIRGQGTFQNLQVDALLAGEIACQKLETSIGILVVNYLLRMGRYSPTKIISKIFRVMSVLTIMG
ncbi:MAG: hypothetical protein Ct9H300mP2_3870 [Candidatus Neomarinimicrobiota bacterium]|nr:MAG: hypothetical protein Ct9H300mP2_3870 [Candidatus Neomarinimicrobiota bacterium]